MLPLPTSSRPKQPRIFFPSLPPNQSYTSQSLLTYLRARTRLTNLAITVILCGLSLSIVLNLSLYLSSVNPFPARRKGIRIPLELEVPLSIETTIERDPRFAELDHLIMVPGHAIWTGHDASMANEDEDWILETMQKGGSVKTFIRHIEEGVERLRADPKALLVYSG